MNRVCGNGGGSSLQSSAPLCGSARASMYTELRERMHDLRSALQVATGFVRWLDPRILNDDGRKLHEASRVSLERMAADLDRMHTLMNDMTFDASGPAPAYPVGSSHGRPVAGTIRSALKLHP